MQTFEKKQHSGNLLVRRHWRNILPILGEDIERNLIHIDVDSFTCVLDPRIRPHTEWAPAAIEARPAGKSLSDWNWNLDPTTLQRLR